MREPTIALISVGRPVGDDLARAPSAPRGRRRRRPPPGSAWRTGSSCPARPAARIVVQKECRPSTSIATVGSSSTSSFGLLTSATAKRTRWVCPPESFCVRCAAISASPVSSSVSSTSSGAGTARPPSRPARAPRGRGSRRRSAASRRPIPASIAARRRAAQDRHAAAVGLGQAEDHVDRGRLAGAVRAQQGDRLARRRSRGRCRAPLRSSRSSCIGTLRGSRSSLPAHPIPRPARQNRNSTKSAVSLESAISGARSPAPQRRARAAFNRSVLPSATLRRRTVSGVTSTHSSSRTNSKAWSRSACGGAAGARIRRRWRSGCW